MSMIVKISKSIQCEGVLKTAVKALNYPFRKYLTKKMLSLESNEDRFTWIYNRNYWSSKQSVSGTGSTLKYTENLRKELPKVLTNFSIKKIFDAPCGDFNWMNHLLPTINVEYIGGDIVRPLIKELNKNYKNNKISFIHIDLTKDAFPDADLMVCRDCLFHLSYEDTKLVLNNFVESGIPYLLTTTYKKTDMFLNKNIQTGDFRLIDLFSSPYNFSSNPLATIDDWIAPDPERQMCLWDREQVSKALTEFD